MPAWGWNSILSYEVAGEKFVAETFIYFTQEGYQHAYGQDHEIELKIKFVQILKFSVNFF